MAHTALVRLKLFDRLDEAFYETYVSLKANATAKQLSNNSTVSSQRHIHIVEF